jgi:hypothetical protein
VLTDPRNRASLAELEQHWGVDDLLDAHMALDLRDELEREANERARQQRARERNKKRGTP